MTEEKLREEIHKSQGFCYMVLTTLNDVRIGALGVNALDGAPASQITMAAADGLGFTTDRSVTLLRWMEQKGWLKISPAWLVTILPAGVEVAKKLEAAVG